jgi:hypothetical protein
MVPREDTLEIWDILIMLSCQENLPWAFFLIMTVLMKCRHLVGAYGAGIKVCAREEYTLKTSVGISVAVYNEVR